MQPYGFVTLSMVLGQNPSGQKPIGQYPSGQNPRDKNPGGQGDKRGTKSKWDKNQGWQKPRGTTPHRDKNPWRTISQGTESQGDKIPRFSQEWCICVLRPEKYMTIGRPTCLVMLRHPPPHIHIHYITLWNFTCCSEPFVLSPAPDANLILMLTRGARLGGATAQSPLGVLPLSSIRAIQHFFWKW